MYLSPWGVTHWNFVWSRLLYGSVCIILCLVVLIQYQNATDRQTETHDNGRYCTSIASCGKKPMQGWYFTHMPKCPNRFEFWRASVITDVMTNTKFFISRFGVFGVLNPHNLGISTGLAGCSYSSVSIVVLHCDVSSKMHHFWTCSMVRYGWTATSLSTVNFGDGTQICHTYLFSKIVEMKQCRTTFNLCLYKCRWSDLINNSSIHDIVSQLHIQLSAYTACTQYILYVHCE